MIPIALSQTRDLLENVSATVHSLVTLGQSLRAELGVVRKNLTDLKAECEQDGNVQSSGVCAEIPSGDGLVAVANFSKVQGTVVYQYTTRIMCSVFWALYGCIYVSVHQSIDHLFIHMTPWSRGFIKMCTCDCGVLCCLVWTS